MTDQDPYEVWGLVENEWLLLAPSKHGVQAQVDRSTDVGNAPCDYCAPKSYDVAEPFFRVVNSKYPVVRALDGLAAPQSVYLYGYDHTRRITDIQTDLGATVLPIFAHKTSEYYSHPNVSAVCIFEVCGNHFGPTLAHPHGQIIGLPFVPRQLCLSGSPGCSLCGSDKDDWLHHNDEAVLQLSPWPRFPLEMVIYPRIHRSYFSELSLAEMIGLIDLLQKAIRICCSNSIDVQYIINYMQAPRNYIEPHHLRIELLALNKLDGTLKRPGGLELGYGIYVNPSNPRTVKRLLSERLATLDP